jgi:hypothetical protein
VPSGLALTGGRDGARARDEDALGVVPGGGARAIGRGASVRAFRGHGRLRAV